MFVLDNDKRNMKKRKFYDEHLGVRPRVEIKLNIYGPTWFKRKIDSMYFDIKTIFSNINSPNIQYHI